MAPVARCLDLEGQGSTIIAVLRVVCHGRRSLRGIWAPDHDDEGAGTTTACDGLGFDVAGGAAAEVEKQGNNPQNKTEVYNTNDR